MSEKNNNEDNFLMTIFFIVILVAVAVGFITQVYLLNTETETYTIQTIEAEPLDRLEEVEVQTIQKDIKILKQEELNTKLDEIKHIEDTKEYFLAYKDLVYRYAAWVESPDIIFDVFSLEDINMLCRVVETETYDQDFDSKVNVACVVLNRLDSGKFGDTITEIVKKPNQFVYSREAITEDTMLAVMYAYEMGDTTQGALYFHSFEKKTKKFCGADYIFTDLAGHHFYG